MKRYALPLIILVVIAGLIALIFFGGSGAPDYSGGNTTPEPITSEWVRGSATSTAVLVEYSDFQCPACKAYEPLMQQVIAAYGDRVAFVYRNFPLYQIHLNADAAARAAEAAGRQGKFWEMHDLLFANQETWDKLVNPWSSFDAYAATIGLNVEQFKTDVASPEVAQAVANDYARGIAQAVSGTPSFFLNGTQIKPGSYQDFAAILDAVLAAH